jgi:hypothetical protein
MWITLSRYPHPNTTNNNNNWIGNPFRITFIKLLIITVNLFQDESSGTERNTTGTKQGFFQKIT